jgi:hypothetical protein
MAHISRAIAYYEITFRKMFRKNKDRFPLIWAIEDERSRTEQMINFILTGWKVINKMFAEMDSKHIAKFKKIYPHRKILTAIFVQEFLVHCVTFIHDHIEEFKVAEVDKDDVPSFTQFFTAMFVPATLFTISGFKIMELVPNVLELKDTLSVQQITNILELKPNSTPASI